MSDLVFDSCTHPTLDGSWIPGLREADCGFDSLVSQMADAGVDRAFAVGLIGVGAYEPGAFAQRALSFGETLMPVAEVDLSGARNAGSVRREVERHRDLGFVGVKVHPRRSGVQVSAPQVAWLVDEAAACGLLPFLCTYFYGDSRADAGNDVTALRGLLASVPEAPLVLLHGGAVRILEVAEAARPFPNVIVDLSFTLCRYAGSSVDLDIEWLCRTFDQRLSVGSDHPEYAPRQARERLHEMASGLDPQKLASIQGGNLSRLVEGMP